MKALTYYNELATPHKTTTAFKKELDAELDEFVGTRAELKDAEASISDKAKILYNENQKKRNDEKEVKREEFKLDLADEIGLSHSHPKLEMLFDKAWDRGHDEGLGQVQWEFEDLSQLLS